MNPKTASPVSPTHDPEGVRQTTSHPITIKETTTVEKPIAIAESATISPAPQKRAQTVAPELEAETIRYDPEAIAQHYGRRLLLVWRRCLAIVWPSTIFAFSLWWDRRLGKINQNQQKRAIQLKQLLTNLGPAYIKIGQALSSRPDLVPPVYLEELTHLQDQLPPFPNEVAYRFIEEELGAPPHQIYAELSPQPLAAASLGQVYKGKLKTGETVAVKVQRPDLQQKIALDLYIMRSLAKWAQKTFKNLRSDLVAILDEFGSRIFEEMDYIQEGKNAERFEQLYGQIPDIYIPRIYWEYTRRRVLTMEWIVGTKLTNLEAMQRQGIDASHLIDVGVQCSLRQLLEHGFFHADPHPGNLLASPDGKLVYLDFGMMSEVKRQQRYGLIEAVVHLVNRDFEGLGQDYIKLEFLAPGTDLTPIIPAFAAVFNDALSATVAEMNFKSITDQLSALMYEFPFRVPAYYALIIRSLVTLEGIAINIDPNFKVLSKAYPYVAKRLLTDPAPELRASLQDLLFKEGGFRWNRLENLIRNARNSSDFDLNKTLEQTVDFLYSERGAFIRKKLVNEIINGLDIFGRNTWENLTFTFRQKLGLVANEVPVIKETPKNLEHIQRIWVILQETPGFDPIEMISIFTKLLLRPETQQMGQQVIGGLTQRTLARLIRELLISDRSIAEPETEYREDTAPRLALPVPVENR
ncbi:ABC1 kinase family protein [Floridanema evergladense]|uniref:ABC1 kinase family protein n=1 Tax=Floridaenema evergladense BLCC-F167 TaxID=3153639 RepID=A0ABV4WRV3_9CYAN